MPRKERKVQRATMNVHWETKKRVDAMRELLSKGARTRLSINDLVTLALDELELSLDYEGDPLPLVSDPPSLVKERVLDQVQAPLTAPAPEWTKGLEPIQSAPPQMPEELELTEAIAPRNPEQEESRWVDRFIFWR
jgi:hypothetical protein